MTQIQNTVVNGQWNAIVTPTDTKLCPINLYANITDQGLGSFSAVGGKVLLAINDNADSSIFEQTSTSLLGKLVGNKVTIALNGTRNNPILTGTISDDGSAMKGSYTDSLGGGTWAAQKRPVATGIYTGTFNSISNPSAKPIFVTANISQDEAFSITGTAVVENSARFTSLVFGRRSRAVGGAMHLVDSSNGVTINLIPNENGKLSLSAPFYGNYQFKDGVNPGDLGTGTVECHAAEVDISA